MVLSGSVLAAAGAFRQPGRPRMLAGFLGAATGLFFVGLLAWAAAVYPVLYVYPFRLADVLLPLFFWLVGIEFLRRTVAATFKRPSRRLIPEARVLALGVVIAAAGAEMARDVTPNFDRYTRGKVAGWSTLISGQVGPFLVHPAIDQRPGAVGLNVALRPGHLPGGPQKLQLHGRYASLR